MEQRSAGSTSPPTHPPQTTHLHVALDEVERRDGHVGEPAAGDASGRAGGVERRRVHLDLLLGRLDRERRRARTPRCRGGRGGEAGGAGEGPRRRRGVEEAREERLAGQVGERHCRRDSEGSLGWANPLGGGGAPCARAVAWIWRKGNGRGGGGGVQVPGSISAAGTMRALLGVGPSGKRVPVAVCVRLA